MPRRIARTLQSSHLTNTAQIFRESIRVLLLHPTHFHSISIFLFSPLSISLFVSYFLIHRYPHLPSSALQTISHMLGKNRYLPVPKMLSKTIIHIIICLPSSITFSLLGKAATIQAVSDSYNQINLNGRRILVRSGLAWVKLLHTRFWECVIVLSLSGAMLASLLTVPKILFASGICSKGLGFWLVLGFLGAPFCVVFAHVMAVGSLAEVFSVIENECHGLDSLMKARALMHGRKQTALLIALFSNVSSKLVECIFGFRLCKGINFWDVPVLVSMYSLVLVLDTVMNVSFYYTCKTWDSLHS